MSAETTGHSYEEPRAAVDEPVAPPSTPVKSLALSKPMLIAGLILATALSALDSTIVSTALPTIVGVLGGLPLYPLVIAAYLLTATTTVPVFGKLSDMYGRKPLFLVGSLMFVVGSALCGLAWNMVSLILFRALQGLGAGAVLPVSLTIIGDVFSVEERARIQGVFSSVWGVASVIGPVIGGAIVQFFDWRWVFFVNVPVGILSALLLQFYLREPHIHTRQKIDVAGAITLTVGVSLALVGLQALGRAGGWPWYVTLLVWGGAVTLLAFFIFFEERAVAPVLSLSLLARPVILIASIAGLLMGGVIIGYGAYVPLLAQGVWGGTPTEAGLIIAPLSLSWPIASAMSGRLLKRYSYRQLIMVGLSIVLAGALLLLLVELPGVKDNPWLRAIVVVAASFVSGGGLGLSTTPMLIAVQVSVPWSERGIATAAVQFFRNMGNALAATVLGAVLTITLAASLAAPGIQSLVQQMPPATQKAGSDPSLGPVNALFDLSVRDTLPRPVRSGLANALGDSLWWVYVGIAIIAVLGAIIAGRFPREVRHHE